MARHHTPNKPDKLDKPNKPNKLDKPDKPDKPDKLTFPIVGIGASAGGMEPLKQFLRALPPDSGLGYVIVQHLSPEHESLMADILGRETAMPVAQMEQDAPVAPDHVYVIRPDRTLTVEGGVLKLSSPAEPRGRRRPIDCFLRSLAEDRREKAVAILLSGSGTNGTVGIKDIKAQGGLVLVQDPQEAEYDGMVRSAIASGQVDFILPVAQMPRMLLEFVRQPYVREEAWRQVPEGFEQIINLLHARQDCDFRSYKQATLVRRIQRRMNLHHIETGPDYLDYLRAHGEELQALAEDLLISVTCFFRDGEAWHHLEQKVVPQLVERQQGQTPLRIWVAGCATGEEVYSLGMILLERFQGAGRHPSFQIFASDLDQRALQVARAGLYPDSIEADVSPERLARFFQKEDHHYRVSKALRDVVVFAVHNILNDPPFSALDLITCRNLLIFLEPEAQRRVFGRFHFALKPDGLLFLGSAETVGGETDLFEAVSKRWRVYRRIGPSHPERLSFGTPSFTRLNPAPVSQASVPAPTQTPTPSAALTDRQAALAEQEVLTHHTQACVVIDTRQQIHYFFGPTADYLIQPRRQATLDLMAWLPDGLRGKLLTVLPQALRGRQPMTVAATRQWQGQVQTVHCLLKPLRGSDAQQPLWLLVFEAQRPPPPASGNGKGAAEQAEMQRLEDELRLCREQLQASSEQLAHLNEEYRSSHEEAISVNEELQSTNEELETSKEELQSFNEELETLNQQLQQKNQDLERAYNDLNNLMGATELATLFLDTQLCIRRFTPQINRLMRLIRSDEGRPIGDIATRFKDRHHLDDARKVLDTLIPMEAEAQTEEGTWYLRRTLPYRTEDNRIDGVVITFLEITERKRAEIELREAKEYAERIIDTLHEPLLVLHPDLRVQSANPAFYEHFQVNPQDTEGRLIYELGNGQWNIPGLRHLLDDVLPTNNVFNDFEVEHDFRDLGARVMLLNGRRLDNVQLILLGIRDITETKQAERALRTSERRLRQMINVEGVGVLIFDKAGTVVDANEAFLTMFGYRRAEVEAGELNWRAMTPDEYIEVSERQLQGLEETGRLGPYEKEYLHKDGSRSWMVFAGADLSDGTIIEYCIDISDRKQAEQALQETAEQLRRQSERLQQEDQNKNRFLGLLGHELRNPLAAIQSTLDWLRRGAGSQQERQEGLNLIHRQGQHLLRLVDDLLNITRISRGTLELAPRPQDLKPLIQDAVDLLRPEIDAHRHHLTLDLPQVPLGTSVDGARLVQVVSNVLGNAVRFTPDAGQLHLSLAREGGQAVIRIKDNGVGIAPEQLPRLFTPFTRLDNPSPHRPGGLGLGLALAYELVSLHGGHLEAFSEGHDRGSEFVIHLPALAEDWQADEGDVPPAPDQAAPDPTPPARRVLVIDDDEPVAKALALLLRSLGHEVQTLHQGREAVARVRDWQPEVVLIDLTMPDISGYEVARQLRRACDGDLTLVAVTGHGLEEDIRRTREAGFDHHLLKPAQVEEIQAILGQRHRQASS